MRERISVLCNKSFNLGVPKQMGGLVREKCPKPQRRGIPSHMTGT